MKNIFMLTKIFNYLKKYKKCLIKNKLYKIENIKMDSKLVKTEYTVICILIFGILIYMCLKKDIKSTIFLALILSNIYITIYLLIINRKISEYIDYKFEKKIEAINLKKRQLIKDRQIVNRLIVLDDFGNDQNIFEIKKEEYIIGKNSKNNTVDIDLTGFLNDSYVSRRQARVYKKNAAFYIVDEGSRNGTDIIKTNNRHINLKAFKEEKILIGDIIVIKDIKILVN